MTVEYSSLNPVIKSFLAGSASGTCSTLFFQPLDLVKTRLQQNVSQPGPKMSGGMIGVMRAVVGTSERGVLALWTGLVPSITRTVPGVGIYFASLEMLRNQRDALFGPKAGGMSVDFAIGLAARVMSATVMNPVSVVKTRYEANGVKYGYRGVGHALVSICRWEGARGLICGLLPTVIRDAPYSGFYFMFYTQLKDRIITARHVYSSLNEDHRLLLCKFIAGAASCAVTHPADVVKTQMQLYPSENRSLRAAIGNIARNSETGIIDGFARGFVPRMIRRTLITALAWTIYEKVMSKKHQKS